MLHNGHAVRLAGTYTHGYVDHYDHSEAGQRWWFVKWEDGTTSVTAETSLVDIERQEWADALHSIPEHLLCPSRWAGLAGSGAGAGRRCGMRVGHRTLRHRNCEISWTDEMTQQAEASR
jgi:hypothetical protein